MDISKAETDHPPPPKYKLRKKESGGFTLTTEGQEGADQFEVDAAKASINIDLNEPAKGTLERIAKGQTGKIKNVPVKK